MSLLTPERLEKIEQMNPEKRDRLLAAAMAEFCKGYKAASTDVVTAAAGISKGLLFHYCGSKQELLCYAAHAAMEVVQRDFLAQVNFEEGDFFRRLWRITSVRFDIMARYPAIFDFLARLATLPEPELRAAADALAGQHPGAFPLAEDGWYQNVDIALFKDGVDHRKVLNVVRWTFAGYAAMMPRAWETGEDPQKVNQKALQEMWDYISFFRKQFYRPTPAPEVK